MGYPLFGSFAQARFLEPRGGAREGVKQILEREAKREVTDKFVLPALDTVGSGASHRTVELTSQYFDTADRDLQAHGLLLRRRDGDDESGWQLKIGRRPAQRCAPR
jgi:hypothetical protein